MSGGITGHREARLKVNLVVQRFIEAEPRDSAPRLNRARSTDITMAAEFAYGARRYDDRERGQ